MLIGVLIGSDIVLPLTYALACRNRTCESAESRHAQRHQMNVNNNEQERQRILARRHGPYSRRCWASYTCQCLLVDVLGQSAAVKDVETPTSSPGGF
jgi:hypothetical protein